MVPGYDPHNDPPAVETGRTVAFSFPDDSGEDVRCTLRIRWENDPNWGVGTVWWAEFSQPPFRMDGESDGLRTVAEVQQIVAAEHHKGDPLAPTQPHSPHVGNLIETSQTPVEQGSAPPPPEADNESCAIPQSWLWTTAENALAAEGSGMDAT